MGKRAYSPRDVLTKKYRTIPWDGRWRESFGEVPENELWFISGASASGKSSFVMQLAKELTKYGTVLYGSYEEGISQSFQNRLKRERMQERQGRFRVITEDTFEELCERLSKPKSAKFVIIDSFQESGLTYAQAMELRERFGRKTFIYISQEHKGEPAGKPAGRLKYKAGVKIRVVGYKVYCQGRFTGNDSGVFTIWEDGVISTTNNLG
ncbi:MAG: AAA family ATPase [Bacteroides sp.]|nr:AAA family ATPase [Bacteroides sp.]